MFNYLQEIREICDGTIHKLADFGDPEDASIEDNGTVLHVCAQFGILQSVKDYLKRSKRRLNTPTSLHLRSPLHLAAMFGHFEVCKELVQSGAYVDGTDKYKKTAYFYASSNGHHKIAKYLASIQNGEDFTETSDTEETQNSENDSEYLTEKDSNMSSEENDDEVSHPKRARLDTESDSDENAGEQSKSIADNEEILLEIQLNNGNLNEVKDEIKEVAKNFNSMKRNMELFKEEYLKSKTLKEENSHLKILNEQKDQEIKNLHEKLSDQKTELQNVRQKVFELQETIGEKDQKLSLQKNVIENLKIEKLNEKERADNLATHIWSARDD